MGLEGVTAVPIKSKPFPRRLFARLARFSDFRDARELTEKGWDFLAEVDKDIEPCIGLCIIPDEYRQVRLLSVLIKTVRDKTALPEAPQQVIEFRRLLFRSAVDV